MEIMVSIIVPVYNSENSIVRCLDSISMQTYSNFEAIIIDDGSIDESLQICNHYSNKDKRFVVKHIENSGVSVARNTGLDLAKGDYISFLDSDDFLAIDFLENMIAKINESQSKIVISSFYREKEGLFIPENSISSFFENSNMNIFNEYNYADTYILRHVWGALYKKDVIGDLRFKTGLCVGEDSLFMAELLSEYPYIDIVQDPLYYYSYTNISASHGSIDLKKSTVINSWYKIIETYSKSIYSTKEFLDGCYLSFYTEILQALKSLYYENRINKADDIYCAFFKAYYSIYHRLLKTNVSWKTKLKFIMYRISPYWYYKLGV